MPRISVGSIELDDDIAQWLNVILNLGHKSRRGLIRELLVREVTEARLLHILKIEKFAIAHKITWEQAYTLLADPDRRPPYTDQDARWARGLSEAGLATSRKEEERIPSSSRCQSFILR